MGGSKSGLAIFALLVGIAGTALGIYSVFFMPRIIMQQTSENSVITGMWYDDRTASWNPSYDFYDITDLEVVITVNPGEKVFFLFNAEFEIDTGSVDNGGSIRFKVNNTELIFSEKSFYGTGMPRWEIITVQYVADSLTPGIYEVHVQAEITFLSAGEIRDMSLLVYTFK